MAYRAKAATVGNSKALRLDSALFREHPEFAAGEFAVSVIAPGCLLIQATQQTADREQDPVFDAYLSFMEHQMATRPDLITAVTHADRREADDLLRDVPAPDRDVDFGDEFSLPAQRRPRASASSRKRSPRERSTRRQTPKPSR